MMSDEPMSDPVKSMTPREVWEGVWSAHSLPQVFKTKDSPYYVDRLDTFFHAHLPKGEPYEFLELGCAPGRWLHYFHADFGYRVSGIDRSPTGIAITRENLSMLDVGSSLIETDLLTFCSDRRYDVVFSMGLVEHFDPPDKVIDLHVSLAKKGGYVVIGVPNIKRSVYGPLQWLADKGNMSGYIHVPAQMLKSRVAERADIVFCGYVGSCNLYLLSVPSRRSIVKRGIGLAQYLLDKIMRRLRVKTECGLFSPYIFVIGRKR